jgi:hypothetical protein
MNKAMPYAPHSLSPRPPVLKQREGATSWLRTFEPERGQIERVNEGIDHANKIALIDPIFEAFRQQRRLPTIRTFNGALYQIPRNLRGGS